MLVLAGQTCYAQEMYVHVMLDSITCYAEEGGDRTGRDDPDELYCFVLSPSGISKRLDLGKWAAIDIKKVNKKLLEEGMGPGQTVNIEFWEDDGGEYSSDDYLGKVNMKVNSATDSEWKAIEYCKVIRKYSNKATLLYLYGAQCDYRIVLRSY